MEDVNPRSKGFFRKISGGFRIYSEDPVKSRNK